MCTHSPEKLGAADEGKLATSEENDALALSINRNEIGLLLQFLRILDEWDHQ